MKRYLIKEWHPHRGQTEGNPSCYFCGGYIVTALENIREDMCYKSLKRAERVAMKYNTIYTRAEVIEVPEEVIV